MESKQFYCSKCAEKWGAVITLGIASRWEVIMNSENLCGDWLLIDKRKMQGQGCRQNAQRVFIRVNADPIYLEIDTRPLLK